MNDWQANQAERLLQRGLPRPEIAALTGLPLDAIDRINAARAAVDDLPDGRWDEVVKTALRPISEGIRELFRRGFEATDICERLGQLVDTIGENELNDQKQQRLEEEAGERNREIAERPRQKRGPKPKPVLVSNPPTVSLETAKRELAAIQASRRKHFAAFFGG
jgi:hypothetical protein